MFQVENFRNPLYLALAIYLTGFAIVVLGLIAGTVVDLPEKSVFVWGIFTSMILLYSIFNSALLFSFSKGKQYWTMSVYTFVALGIACVLTSWLLSGVSLNEAGGFRPILSVLVIGYSIMLGIGWTIVKLTELTTLRDSEKLKKDSDAIGHDL